MKIIAHTSPPEGFRRASLNQKFQEAYQSVIESDELPQATIDILTEEKEGLFALFNKIMDYEKHYLSNREAAITKHPYLTHMDELEHTYDIFCRKKGLDPKSFSRERLLINFCRALIPEVAHPLIHVSQLSEQSKEYLYDALTTLVMMDTMWDDSADDLQLIDLVEAMGHIHRNASDTSNLDEADMLFFNLGKKLWNQALNIIDDCIVHSDMRSQVDFELEVLPRMDDILQCMREAIRINRMVNGAYTQEHFYTFQEAIEKFSAGMMTDLFFYIESVTIHSTQSVSPECDPYQETNQSLRSFFQEFSTLSSKAGRLANDLVTIERELESGDRCNSLLHLYQEIVSASSDPDNSPTFLKEKLEAYLKTKDTKHLRDIKNELKRKEIKKLVYKHWLALLEQSETLLNNYPGLSTKQRSQLQEPINRHNLGQKRLLGMYMIMATFEGAT